MPPSYHDPQKHRRRSIRLEGYDYSQPGAYFVTICTRGKQCLLGKIINGEMELNELGEIVEAAWFDLPVHYTHIELGTFCIMPNHVHAIIIVNDIDTRVGGGRLSSSAEMQTSPYAGRNSIRYRTNPSETSSSIRDCTCIQIILCSPY